MVLDYVDLRKFVTLFPEHPSYMNEVELMRLKMTGISYLFMRVIFIRPLL